ncbi:uncharacterized protein RCC_01860 [Ramularia collo-cygni]|uniref:Uncharacterized protein n=1 Tax=Ramularia collo-cygni TaxID=112498 RepID=A0A2D3UTA4_9PEZI|nr:uncharacterized protein RCC_01860 [Ramularia collo-cygni]CZT16020.1 uncharacterized protein RCC_01860 [Ramularia collo-cygni]
MFLLRTTARQQPRFLVAATRAPAPGLGFISKRFNSSDYGSGEHNNLKNPKADHEHPGPPPPNTNNKGGAPSSSSQENSTSQKSESGDGGEKPKPKILNASPPKSGEEPEDVKKHNEEMAQRAERPVEGQKN